MTLDIAILVAIALCQGATGYWAFHMSAQDSRARWGFGIVTLMGIALVIWSGIRTTQSSSHIERSLGHIEKTIGALSQPREPSAFYAGNTLVARFSNFMQDNIDTHIVTFPSVTSFSALDFSQTFFVQSVALKCSPVQESGSVTFGGETHHEYSNVTCRIVGNAP